MKKSIYYSLLIVIFLTLACQSPQVHSIREKKPKNVILFIGDGMGVTQVQAAMTANNNSLNLEKCTIIGLSKTSSSDKYITDSAAGATAIACGVKTYNGAIGVDSLQNEVNSILDYAEKNGLSTGLVATSTITHATPASFIAHDISRRNYEAIAKDFLDIDIDLFIGGGLKHFTEREDGLNLVDQLKENNYQVALELEDLDQFSSGKIAGLLNDEAMPPVLEGRGDMLAISTMKAIDVLSQNENGFFLMVEGSQIDWGGHDNDINYVVSELLDFDRAIGKAIEFAIDDGNTLIIITADHETGGLTILGENILSDSTATNFSTRGHTPVMVPVYAFGPQAENYGGIYENTALFFKTMEALELNSN